MYVKSDKIAQLDDKSKYVYIYIYTYYKKQKKKKNTFHNYVLYT